MKKIIIPSRFDQIKLSCDFCHLLSLNMKQKCSQLLPLESSSEDLQLIICKKEVNAV